MLTALLGDSVDLEPVKQLIKEKTVGNPFFIEEMVQALTERGVLVHTGAVKLAQPLTQLEIPPTIQRILSSRIDWLPRDEKELLQTLAVVGPQFQLSLIKLLVHDLPAARVRPTDDEGGDRSEEVERTLSNLQLGEFIYERPSSGDVVYRFKHALTQEVRLQLRTR